MSSKLKKLGTLADIYQAQNLDGAITRIPIEKLHPSEEQPRRDRTHAVAELAESIKKDGLLSPIVVTKDGEGYRIIAGERRFHAVTRLGWPDVECRIISREERDYFRIAIVENLQRENLSAEEEASALLRLKLQENYSDADLAEIVGKSRNYVTEIVGIASLPEDVLDRTKKLGIDNKNFLIQVVQAHKKGSLDDFFKAYAEGSVRTVRDAREFLQKGTKTRQEKGAGIAKKKTSDIVRVQTHGSRVTVECADDAAARRIEKLIRNLR